MALGQRPPTTSGIVVLSGSEGFGLSGDFPVLRGLIFDSIPEPPQAFLSSTPLSEDFPVIGGLLFDSLPEPTQVFLSSTPDSISAAYFETTPSPMVFVSPDEGAGGERQANVQFINTPDYGITSTPVTTSGIVLFDVYPGAGTVEIPWVPPVVLNARTFPLYQGPFPEHNLRIYPVLPQYSTLTPGD